MGWLWEFIDGPVLFCQSSQRGRPTLNHVPQLIGCWAATSYARSARVMRKQFHQVLDSDEPGGDMSVLLVDDVAS
jgi:hypothetical protein